MNLFTKFRNGSQRELGDSDAPALSASDADLTERYERLNERDAVTELGQLCQADLGAIETFERSHGDRSAVLNKLRYLRQPEPLPGYDQLERAVEEDPQSTPAQKPSCLTHRSRRVRAAVPQRGARRTDRG